MFARTARKQGRFRTVSLQTNSEYALIAEFASIRKVFWGRHIWARGFFVASSGNVTEKIVREYIEKQEIPKPDDNFKVDNEN